MSDGQKGPGPGGCFIMLLFFVVEIAVGFAVGGLFYRPIRAIMGSIVPVAESDFASVASVCLCFIPAFFAVWAIDRLCVKLTGHSVLDNIPHLP